MARETCIKTATGTYCSASPIRNCSCEPFESPLPDVPDRVGSPGELKDDFKRVLKAWKALELPPSEDKFRLIATITRLVLLPDVTIEGPVIITSIDVPDKAGR